jgi:hypothetical protein
MFEKLSTVSIALKLIATIVNALGGIGDPLADYCSNFFIESVFKAVFPVQLSLNLIPYPTL